MRLKVWVVLGLVVGSSLGCGSITNLATGPQVMGGSRYDWQEFYIHPRDLESSTFALYDVPFSFCLDLGLLPVTLIFELTRALSGWPPAQVEGACGSRRRP